MFIPHYEKTSDDYFMFGANVSAVAHECLNNDSIKSYWNGFCSLSSEMKVNTTDELIFSVGKAQKPETDGNQYAVNVEKNGIYIVADSKKGLINGFMTLLHQIKIKEISEGNSVFQVKCGLFKEKPYIKNQMIHFCIFPETKLWELERFIKLCAVLKYSHIILEFWGMLKFDCMKELSWSHSYSKESIRPLIQMANESGTEIIPMFNHWGHASASRVIYGKHVVLDQNPKLQPLFSDDGWSWNIQNPKTLSLLRNIREELTELCGNGEYFHLGCDEAYNVDITTENYHFLTDYLNTIADELKAQNRRPIVWGDMLVAHSESFNKNNRYTASCKSKELEHCILSDLSRNIIIADWQYNVKESPVETSLVFNKEGFDTLICPWDNTYKVDSVTPCVNTARQYGLYGVLHTTWNTLSKGMPDVSKSAFAAWNTSENNEMPERVYFTVNTAKILRNIFPVYGNYEKAGWAEKQVDIIE